MAEFDTGLPSVRQVQTLIKDKQKVELKVSTDDLLVGTILWQDAYCICLIDEYEQPTLIWRQSIVYLKSRA